MEEREEDSTSLVRIGPVAPSRLVERALDYLRDDSIIRVENSLVGLDKITIPAGEFMMGSDSYDDEKPVRRVYLDAYWISKNPVTVAEFRTYCQATGYQFEWDARRPAWGWIDNHPIVRVTWEEAKVYCRWAGGELPTEAQWEKAARGTDGRIYPWGKDWNPSLCRCSKEYGDAKSTSPVGSYPDGASPYGVLDLAGNVWEWCSDWYQAGYEGLPSRNPTGPAAGTRRVLRGGSWFINYPDFFRSASRFSDFPAVRSSDFGFRLAGPP